MSLYIKFKTEKTITHPYTGRNHKFRKNNFYKVRTNDEYTYGVASTNDGYYNKYTQDLISIDKDSEDITLFTKETKSEFTPVDQGVGIKSKLKQLILLNNYGK